MSSTALHRARASRRAELDRRVAAGERAIGRKIALTSPAAQHRVGADRPIWGWLTDAMEIPDGGTVTCRAHQRTRAEPELVFVLSEDLVGPGLTREHVLGATAAICAGIELPCSEVRTEPPTVAELIAGNASAGSFVIGEPVLDWVHLDLRDIGVLLEVDGQVVASGTGAAVLGHPAHAIAQLVNDLAQEDATELRAGELIFTGGLTAPAPLQAGMSVAATFDQLGRIGLNTVAQT
jgi:2-keto-4-pentenoate hydratase